MNRIYKLKHVIITCLCLGTSMTWSQITTFSYTGAPETYTVPASVTSISIEVSGGQGGEGNGGPGGLGATMYGEFTVSPGDNLEVIVGQAGAFGYNAGGGGGGTGVVFGGVPMIIAGGGGGGSIYDPGYGGAITEAGVSSSGAGGTGGMGGEKGYRISDCGWSAGGGGFYGDGYGGDGDWDGGALPGTLAGVGAGLSYSSGGAGGVNGGCSFSYPNSGAYGCGGGGAGSYGGGGGGGYSGGGGGQYVDVALNRPGGGGGSYNDGTDQVNTPDNNAGDGQVIITVLCNLMTVTVSDYEICFGDELTLDAESEEGAAISWDMGAIDEVPFVPTETGVITYTATSDGEDCPISVDITVYELPVVNAGSGDENYCIGEEVVLAAGGNADTYVWDPTDLEPGLGTHTYMLTGESAEGCISTDEVTITVHELPTVGASIDYDEICEGHPVIVSGSGADSYVWDPADIVDGEAFDPGPVGTYTYNVVGTDVNGCVGEASVSVTVVEGITITYVVTDELVFEDGEIDITVTGGVPPYTFDWDNGETTEDLTGLADGSYTVVVNGSTGCTATEAFIYVGSTAGLDNEGELIMSVFPNPVSDFVTISVTGDFQYELTTVEGKVVMNGVAVDQKMLSVELLSTGTYFIHVIQNGTLTTSKMVKN